MDEDTLRMAVMKMRKLLADMGEVIEPEGVVSIVLSALLTWARSDAHITPESLGNVLTDTGSRARELYDSAAAGDVTDMGPLPTGRLH